MGRIFIFLVSLLGLAGCVTEQTFIDSKKQVRNFEFDKNDAAKTRLILGLSYLENNHYEQAKFNLEKALDFAPERADVNYSIGYYYQLVGEMKQAESYYLKAIKLEPKNPDTFNNYGTFLCNNKQPEKAERYFKQAIDISKYTRAAESYENMAICALLSNQYNKASQYYELSYKHNPTRPNIAVSLAGLNYATGDLVAALDFLGRYNRLKAPSPRGALLGYILENKRGRISEANKYAGQLKTDFVNSAETNLLLTNLVKNSEFELLKKKYSEQFRIGSASTPKIKITPKTESSAIGHNKHKRLQGLSAPSSLTSAALSVSEYKKEIQQKVDMFSAPLSDTERVELPTQLENTVSLQKEAPLPAEQVMVSEVTVAELVNDRAETDKQNKYLKLPKVNLTVPRYEVKEADNLFRVSKRYNIKITSLIFWNKLQKESLETGQSLIIAEPNPVIKVKEDKLLSELASEQGINLSALMAWNKQKQDGWLKAGTKVALVDPITYGYKSQQKYISVNLPDINLPYHEVKDGEFLYTLSNRYNIKIKALKKWNKLKSGSNIQTGQKLWLTNPDIYYTVTKPQSLADVANELNVDLSNLMKWNQIQQNGLLKQGTKLLKVDNERYK